MRTDGPRVRKFIETHLVHSVGDQFGEPFRLRPWQVELIDDLYELDGAGRRRWRRALVGLPKGNGKSELAAALALFELFTGDAPVIPVAAANFEQADITFGAAKTMVMESPTLCGLAECYDTEIRLREAPGRLHRVAAIGPTNDGMRPTMAVFDELHEVTGSKERMHLIVSNGLAKRRGSFELNITTAGVAGTDSLCERLYRRGRDGTDPRLFFRWWSASPHWDLTDPDQRRRAVIEANPAAGDWLDVDHVLARFDEIPVNEWGRYHLNAWSQSATQWLPLGAWEALAAPVAVPEDTEVVLGFDGSYSRDSTALVGCTASGYVFVVAAWERPAHDPDWRVPRMEVEEVLEEAFDRWQVRELAFDPPGWHRESEDWAARWGESRVVQFPTNSRQRMVPACGRFYTAVTTGTLSHDGDPRLAAHLRNAETKDTPWGTLIVKEHKDSPNKIDLAVAAVIAFERATGSVEVAVSKYETEDLLVI